MAAEKVRITDLKDPQLTHIQRQALDQASAHPHASHGAPTGEVGLTMTGEIIVGKFVDRDRPDYSELLKAQMHESLGDRYVDYDEEQGYACSTDGGCAEDSCH